MKPLKDYVEIIFAVLALAVLVFVFWYFHFYHILFSCVETYLLPKFCSA